MLHFEKIAQELKLAKKQVQATLELLDEGGTVPFIARYRKEMTENLDEVEIMNIRDRIEQLRELDKRREAILKSITEQGKLTPELEEKINLAENMARLEDMYLPYKPKRRTKATIAREKGLEPLAQTILLQESSDIIAEANTFIDAEKGVNTIEEALEGARHIIAEIINENAEIRAKMRDLFWKKGIITTKVLPDKENNQEAQKFKDYFEWSENIANAPSHRVLAMRRGEKELFLSLDISPTDEEAIPIIEQQFITARNQCASEIKTAIADCYKRLLKSSMETEVRLMSKKKADEEAIRVFAENIRELLLAAPLGEKTVLTLDPGFKSGCKLVVLDKSGKLLENDIIYPNVPQRETAKSSILVKNLCAKYNVEAIAIGNGTASRETETFVKELQLTDVQILMVNESGASIYSASAVARDEFPDEDITVRGSVSIGRRLQDPLAELVKIDPKSIGVGQYQHDVDQNALKSMLDDVVMSCVNAVGVEVNTASKQLLTYVAGLGETLAQNIIEYRNTNGAFKSRSELKKVARLGAKAFEQCAGFLRIRGAENPLDSSAVHPESYGIVEKMSVDLGCKVVDIIKERELRDKISIAKYVTETIGLPTLNDIVQELAKPGRDPRQKFEAFSFAEGVNEMKDLRVGMKLPGIVTNVTKFGAFVDIGVHQDGLVHISEMSDKYITDTSEAAKVGQKVMVTVMEVDSSRKRIALSMKASATGEPKPKRPEQSENNDKSDRKTTEKTNQTFQKTVVKDKKEELDDFQAQLAALKKKFR